MNPDLKKRLALFALVLVVALAFLAPTLFRDTMPKGWISRPISLGLDLSGGAHLVYEVQSKEAVKSYLQTLGSSIRNDLRKEKIAITKAKVSDSGDLELTLLSDRSVDQSRKMIEDSFRSELAFLERRDDAGKVTLVYGLLTNQAAAVESRAVAQAAETLRARVDQFGVAEPLIQTIGENGRRIMLQMPGVKDIESVKRVVGSVAKLDFRFLAPPGRTTGVISLKDRDGVPVLVEDEIAMAGDMVQTAQIAFPQGLFEVHLTMNSEGTKRFRQITTEGTGRNLAIILDNVVFSSPVIREPIPTGSATISGSFSEQEAKELAVVLRSGALPAPLKVMEERSVGPSLGAESIRSGVVAIVGGFIFIMLFMVIYYRKSGLIAVGSLAMNMVLILAALSAFGATLTLPGLAGLALTIGMAVDSNVLIFERIRDELNNGAGRDAAVHQGFKAAMSAILDANLTTLLTGGVLYFLGTGPIKGFAITLAIGIATTIFCATFVSRLAFDLFTLKGGKTALSI